MISQIKSIVGFVKTDRNEDLERFTRLEKELLSIHLPNVWNINMEGNMEIKMEVEFDKFLFAISEHTSVDLEKLTAFKFYSLIDYLKSKNPKLKIMSKEINLLKVNEEKEKQSTEIRIDKPIEDLSDTELRQVVEALLNRSNDLSKGMLSVRNSLNILTNTFLEVKKVFGDIFNHIKTQNNG